MGLGERDFPLDSSGVAAGKFRAIECPGQAWTNFELRLDSDLADHGALSRVFRESRKEHARVPVQPTEPLMPMHLQLDSFDKSK